MNEHGVRFGLHLWSQVATWSQFRDAAVGAEQAGWDSVWTWDHLMAIYGPPEQPIHEGWMLLAGIAQQTSRVRLSLMVGANTFRNPALTAKLAATLDHLSDGRCTLGIGAAWMEREHDAFDIPFGRGFGERLDRLDEAVQLMRHLLDGDRFDYHGSFYTYHDAHQAPRPVQAHLPILIGGSGRRKTLRIVASHADAWNASGSVEELGELDGVLRDHCGAVRRDQAEIERTASFPIILRDDVAEGRRAWAALLAANQVPQTDELTPLVGPPAVVAEQLRPYLDLGFRTIIVRHPAPYDRETIDRIGELRTALDG